MGCRRWSAEHACMAQVQVLAPAAASSCAPGRSADAPCARVKRARSSVVDITSVGERERKRKREELRLELPAAAGTPPPRTPTLPNGHEPPALPWGFQRGWEREKSRKRDTGWVSGLPGVEPTGQSARLGCVLLDAKLEQICAQFGSCVDRFVHLGRPVGLGFSWPRLKTDRNGHRLSV
jgi:hypothetical protein